MALTVTEANAVNVLARALYPEARNAPQVPPSAGAVLEAASFLLGRAQATLGAGLGPRDLPAADQ